MRKPRGARRAPRPLRRLGPRLAAGVLLAGCVDNLAVCVDTTSDPAIIVEISDAVTGAPLAAGAGGVIRDGAYVDSLRPLAPDALTRRPSLGAGLGRAGTYDVTVVHAGYLPWEQSGIQVGTNACGLIGRMFRVRLVPAP